MATLQDLFTGGYDTAIWDVSKTNANTTVTGVGNLIEVVNTDGNGGYEGLTSKIAYDLSALSLVSAVPEVLGNRFELWISPHDLNNIDPTTVANYIMIRYTGGDLRILQRISSGTPTDTYLTGGATSDVLELNMPTTGNEVRAIINTVEQGSLASFTMSRTCYIGLFAYTDTAAQEVHFDTFNMTYQAAATSSLLLLDS